MNMASIDIDVLKNMIAQGVQIIAYKQNPGDMWSAIPSRKDPATEMEHYAIIPENFHELPVALDQTDGSYKMMYQGKGIFKWKFSNGWEWSHERGLYDSHWKEPAPVKTVEKYYRIRICGDDVQFTEMTAEIHELVQASKELGLIVATAVAAVQRVEKEKDNG